MLNKKISCPNISTIINTNTNNNLLNSQKNTKRKNIHTTTITKINPKYTNRKIKDTSNNINLMNKFKSDEHLLSSKPINILSTTALKRKLSMDIEKVQKHNFFQSKKQIDNIFNSAKFSEKPVDDSIKSKLDQLVDNTKLSQMLDALPINEQPKKKRFIKFVINDNEKNQKLHLKNNEIITTKYNILTFLPKGLLIQFMHISNIYFLLIAIIQSISMISPLNPITAIVPLIFVLGVSLIREFLEDYSRRVYDNLNNNEKVYILRDGFFQENISKNLHCGEIIFIKENRTIPADMLLIDSGLSEGICYVETSSLDGEKALKLKISNKKTSECFRQYVKNNNNIENINFGKFMQISGKIKVEMPNINLNQIEGNATVEIKNKQKKNIGELYYFPITNKEFLLKGSVLRNTNWVIGIVLYTGKNNKIILNSKKAKIKVSLLEKNLNKFLTLLLIFIVFLCLFTLLNFNINRRQHKQFYSNFLTEEGSLLDIFIIFFTYFLLLNTIIPISLIVTLEIIRLILGFFIQWDIQLFSKLRNVFGRANTVSIIEELGSVNFIFSDKTGTLTMNILKFKFCIINESCYEYKRACDFSREQSLNAATASIKKKLKYVENIYKFEENYFLNFVEKEKNKLKEIMNNKPNTNIIKNIREKVKDISIIHEFWIALTLTNECMIIEDKGEIKYIGTSPDDLELLKMASIQGYKLIESTINKKTIKMGKALEFEVLNVLGFSSERKRMSIIVRDPLEGVIKIFCKGADCEIIKRLAKTEFDKKSFKIIKNNIEEFSKLGYRTLMVAYKIINETDYKIWIDRLQKEELNLNNKNYLIDKYYDIMEDEFELLGGTVVEDQLQDKVPETIEALRKADIRIWVLTGDKIDTLESIGLSSNLLSKNDKIFKLSSILNDKNIISSNKFQSEISFFFEEFQSYLNITIKKNNLNIGDSVIMRNNQFNYKKQHNKNAGLNTEEIVNWDILNDLTKENILGNFSILIESPILSTIFIDPITTDKFLKIATLAKTVICCRVSSLQKSEVVKKMKQYDQKAITLAIGDGCNDVAMLTEANIGVGIFGEEGVTAAQSGDFAIGEFKFLGRLLFFHGRIDFDRIKNMVNYFLYKNFIFTFSQIFFSIYNLSSGQTIIDDWFITCYNLIFTALPLCIVAFTNIDVKSDNNDIKTIIPIIYKESREIYSNNIYNIFFYISLKGVILSILICLFCTFGNIIDNKGNNPNIWSMSLKIYTCFLVTVNINLLIKCRFIVFYLPITILVSCFLLYVLFLFLVHYGLFFDFNSKATIYDTISNFDFYLTILSVSALNVIVDYSEKVYNSLFKKTMLNVFEKNMENNEIFLNASKIGQLQINNSNNNNGSSVFDIKNDNGISSVKVYRKQNDSSLECLNFKKYQSIG